MEQPAPQSAFAGSGSASSCADAERTRAAPETEFSTAAALAVAAIAHAQFAARDLVETLAGAVVLSAAADDSPLDALLATARRVADSAAAASQALGVAVNAKAAVVAEAAVAATEARMTEARLTHEILHDSLTGLPNRRLLLDRLTHALARCKRTGTFVAVLFLDLDHFKSVNDRFGHAAGDQLLVGVARSLQESIRDSDTCARVGGDEFIVVLEDMAEASDGALLAARLETALGRGVPVGDQVMPVYASVGIAVSSEGSLPADLLAEADIAMYRVKGTGQEPKRRRLTVPEGVPAEPTTPQGGPPHTRRRADRP